MDIGVSRSYRAGTDGGRSTRPVLPGEGPARRTWLGSWGESNCCTGRGNDRARLRGRCAGEVLVTDRRRTATDFERAEQGATETILSARTGPTRTRKTPSRARIFAAGC